MSKKSEEQLAKSKESLKLKRETEKRKNNELIGKLEAFIKIEVYCKQKIEDLLSTKTTQKSKREVLAKAQTYQDVINYIQKLKGDE